MNRLNIKNVSALIVLTLLITAVPFIMHMNGGSLDITNRELLIVVTDSMDGPPQPYDIQSIPRNSLVMVETISADGIDNLKIGDVIGFRTAVAEGQVFHRIQDIDTATKSVTLRGDQSHFSETVDFDDIISIVRGVDPTLGGMALFIKLNLPYLAALMVMTAVLLHLLDYLRKEGSDFE